MQTFIFLSVPITFWELIGIIFFGIFFLVCVIWFVNYVRIISTNSEKNELTLKDVQPGRFCTVLLNDESSLEILVFKNCMMSEVMVSFVILESNDKNYEPGASGLFHHSKKVKNIRQNYLSKSSIFLTSQNHDSVGDLVY